MKIAILFYSILLSNLIIAQNSIQKKGWELTFNDEFNAKKLDYKKWIDHYYWGGRQNKDKDTYYGENQFLFTDSTLKIVAEKKEEKEGIPYTSGMIDCSQYFKQQFGYFEIRCKMPQGTGFWPAFWLVSTEKWPPEIDVFEIYTNEPNRISTTQHWLNKRNRKKMQPKNYKRDNLANGFHTFAVEWTPKKIIWYYDDKKMRSSKRGVKFMPYKMHIIINLEVGGWNESNVENATFPNNLEVDYVRVYKQKKQ